MFQDLYVFNLAARSDADSIKYMAGPIGPANDFAILGLFTCTTEPAIYS